MAKIWHIGRRGSGVITMLRMLLGATAVALLTGAARAQVTPISSGVRDGYDMPSITEWSPYYQRSRTPEEAGRDTEIEANYRAAVAKIPDRKPSNDPWKSIRPATAGGGPPSSAIDGATASPPRHPSRSSATARIPPSRRLRTPAGSSA
jgi:hypothetical protein